LRAATLDLVVLDRDGVINIDSTQYIKSPAEWIPVPGALDAIAELTRADIAVVVATNQSAVGRGMISEATLGRIHARMIDAVESAGGRLSGIYYCPHRPDANCECRKPRPGLLRQIEADFGRPLAGVPFIGDSESDVNAALAVGARPILIGAFGATQGADVESFADLRAAVRSLIGEAER
jgi:D-glycero-D-manno-heptose 1,7-bisphosphate phosphatase